MAGTSRATRSVRRLRVATIAVTALAILLFLAVSWRNYDGIRKERIADAQASAEKTLIAVDDHVAGLIDYADSYLRALRAFYLEHGGGDALRAYIADTRIVDPQWFIGDIGIVDAAGNVTFTLSSLSPPNANIADRDYFQALATYPGDVLLIDPTLLGRATHQYFFRAIRPIRVGGRFAGAITVAMRPEALVDLYRQFELGPHSNISVLQTDAHQFIALHPAGDASFYGKRFDNLELWDRLKENPHGVYHRVSPFDGVERYYAYRKSSHYPIASVVSVARVDIDAALADARREIVVEAVLFAVAAAVICLLLLRAIGTEERLVRANANLVHAQRMGKIGSVEVDLVTMDAHWSDELYRIYGRDPKLGPARLEEFLAYVHPDDRAVAEEMRHQHETGDVHGPNEYRILLPGGEVRWIHREIEVVRDAAGKPATLITTEQDITDQKRAELEKDAFVATVSHELRTPLTSIRGALGLIASGVTGALPDKAQKMFDVAHRNSERLSHLVNDLLDLQRIAAGQMAYKVVETPIATVVADAIGTIKPFAEERGVRIEAAGVADAVVAVDPERMAQVMDNLLSNAIKFSKPGGTVTVTVARRAPWLRITVEDRGEGIPEAFRARIFERFSQADSGNMRRSGGSGLGLSIVSAIVGHHGGRVSFDSELGVGSRFHVDLREIVSPPASDADALAGARSDAES